VSHTRATESSPPETMSGASAAGQQELTNEVCPLYIRMRPPVFTSHNATSLSADAETAFSAPSQWTSTTAFAWPLSVSTFLHSPKVSHSSSVLSCEPDSSSSPPGLNFTVCTAAPWPASSRIGASRSEVRCGPATSVPPAAAVPAAGTRGPLASVRCRFATRVELSAAISS